MGVDIKFESADRIVMSWIPDRIVLESVGACVSMSLVSNAMELWCGSDV